MFEAMKKMSAGRRPPRRSAACTSAGWLGKPHNLLRHASEALTDQPWQVELWGYVVYEYGREARARPGHAASAL